MRLTDWVMGICLVVFLCFIYGYVDGSIQMNKAQKECGK